MQFLSYSVLILLFLNYFHYEGVLKVLVIDSRLIPRTRKLILLCSVMSQMLCLLEQQASTHGTSYSQIKIKLIFFVLYSLLTLWHPLSQVEE